MHFFFHFYLVLDSFPIKYETCVSQNQIKILNPYTLAYFLNRLFKLILENVEAPWYIGFGSLMFLNHEVWISIFEKYEIMRIKGEKTYKIYAAWHK